MNDYDDDNDSAGYADLLADLGFFVVLALLVSGFGGIVYYLWKMS